VNPDCSLSPVFPANGTEMPSPDAAWFPCLVASWDPARPWARPRARSRQAGFAVPLHLVDRWDRVELVASSWGCGSSPLDQLTVGETAQRMRILALIANPPAAAPYVAASPVRPKVWETDWAAPDVGETGIRRLEQRWAAAVDAAAAGNAPAQGAVRARTGHNRDTAEQQSEPLARLHPLQRAAQRVARAILAEQQNPQRPQRRRPPPRPPDPDDVSDAANQPSPAQPRPPWASAYSRLNQRRLPRRQRWVALQLLHGALPCAAYKHQHSPDRHPCGRCPVPACAGASANLTHIFGRCSVAAAVVNWICDVWMAIEPGNRPPTSFAVIAAGDFTVWRPHAPDLWLRLRLQLIFSLWQAADMAKPEKPPSAAAIAASVVAGIAAAVRMDWLRASMPVHELAGACGQWLTGAGPMLTPAAARDQFAALWCVRGVLCQYPASPSQPLVVRWSTVWPVPIPVIH
jgi:hypothetical protein